MQQIADWLKELDMAESAERFAENHIDSGVLRDLTDQDLKDLGVVSIGHRRKMLRGISELALKLARFRADPPDFPLGAASNPLSGASVQKLMGRPLRKRRRSRSRSRGKAKGGPSMR